jgi:hypothetical protein
MMGPEHVDFEHGAKAVRGDVVGARQEIARRAGDQNVDVAERVMGLSHDTCHGCGVAHIRRRAGGLGAAVLQHLITVESLPESDDPMMTDFRERFEARYPDLARQNRPDLGDVLGYGGALAFTEGLRRAGKDLTRDNFIEALESLDNFETNLRPGLRKRRRQG